MCQKLKNTSKMKFVTGQYNYNLYSTSYNNKNKQYWYKINKF